MVMRSAHSDIGPAAADSNADISCFAAHVTFE